MSFNDRCQEALDAMEAGAPIPNTPAVRAFVRAILQEGVDGIRFAYGLRDVAREIRDGAPTPSGSVPGGES